MYFYHFLQNNSCLNIYKTKVKRYHLPIIKYGTGVVNFVLESTKPCYYLSQSNK